MDIQMLIALIKVHKEAIQDNIFFICSISNGSGTLITKKPGQENFCITRKGFEEQKLDSFNGLTLAEKDDPKYPWLNESVGLTVGY